jgi:hypothetical protein
VFSSSFARTVRPRLHPDEVVLAAVMAQATGASAQFMAHAVGTATAAVRADERSWPAHDRAQVAAAQADIGLARRMVLAVTTERLLVFRARGAFTVRARELVGSCAVENVDGIDVVPGRRTKAVITLRVLDSAIEVETARGQHAKALPAALERARSRARILA